MKLFSDKEWEIGKSIAKLNYANPFSQERMKLEKGILGCQYSGNDIFWNKSSYQYNSRANIKKIEKVVEELIDNLYKRIKNETKIDKEELIVYENIVIYHLFELYRYKMTDSVYNIEKNSDFSFYEDFKRDFYYYYEIPGIRIQPKYNSLKVFEIYYQIHRAFYYIFDFIVGGSEAISNLRAAIWQSIFTHDINRYVKNLYNKMQNITTLITGPSGTGKELVARAVALSQYIPFDTKRRQFKEDYKNIYYPLHLSAMPQSLIESELFGHQKGAYTGALQDRAGWMELCSEYGTVFLDEIGEINEEIQVKLLRLLQSRQFQRLGGMKTYSFKGKILSATNRNLEEAVENKKFRLDLYYRLCSDKIETPILFEQLSGSEKELRDLVYFLATAIIGKDESEKLTTETVKWIKNNLGLEYKWPGNVRELEQCIRSILIRGNYNPLSKLTEKNESIEELIQNCNATADELLNHYCKNVYNRTSSYLKTADILKIDRRTVKKRVLNT